MRVFRILHHLRHFNSIKVRLELFMLHKLIEPVLFQFHKGTIRTLPANPPSAPPDNFNSIKVRLELRFAMTIIHIVRFQFHKGTIRTK